MPGSPVMEDRVQSLPLPTTGGSHLSSLQTGARISSAFHQPLLGTRAAGAPVVYMAANP